VLRVRVPFPGLHSGPAGPTYGDTSRGSPFPLKRWVSGFRVRGSGFRVWGLGCSGSAQNRRFPLKRWGPEFNQDLGWVAVVVLKTVVFLSLRSWVRNLSRQPFTAETTRADSFEGWGLTFIVHEGRN